jgi:two-component system, OmpR family, sensor histidine kinase KdpD
MTDDNDNRPDPETLLKLIQVAEAEPRSRLKIFLGYAAGVGKTYAMLEAARQRRQEGRDVVVGYVESHGRQETDALLEGMMVIPPAQISYQGVSLPEMDLDAVLSRRPQIVLVDELAHTNAPGSRHDKRWQDVEELLGAGIDVYTTVNVQHFESLNDVVAKITGIVVRETVPDRLLDEAAEIRLVDIPPEELLQRLQEGKVYLPQKAAAAVQKFFQPGNLIALRELSLRRAASRVDGQMRAYMESNSIAGPWPAGERLLVCISGGPSSEKLIRSTRRLADELNAPWLALYIETPGGTRQLQENRELIWKELRLAETLGAQVTSLTAESIPHTVAEYALQHNVTKIVVGKPTKPRWREFLRQPLVDQIIRLSGTIDVYVVSIQPAGSRVRKRGGQPQHPVAVALYLKSLIAVLLATLACEALRHILAPTNMVMIYLLAVVMAALRLGRKPAILTAFLSVVAFDFFFVPPRLTLAVADTEYLITFLALFTVGVVISTLVSKTRERAETLREREVQTASLYYLSRDLAGSGGIEAIMDAVTRNVEGSLHCTVAILLPEGERLEFKGGSPGCNLDSKELAVADWAFRNGKPAGRGTDTLGSSALLFLPLQGSATLLGVLGVTLENDAEHHSPQIRRLLDAFASQAAMAMERVQLGKQAAQAQLLQARETLERALLNSISHDLRTPLSSIIGVLSSLKDEGENLGADVRRELLESASEEANRLNRFVGNLLDMTRVEAGKLALKKELCDVQDLIGCALAALEPRISSREVAIRMLPMMPLVPMDLVLMTQVVVNLLENTLKYSPPATPVEIIARTDPPWLVIEVADEGRGVPDQDLKRIFDKFYRIPVPEGAGGTGLGLSICKGIVEAHGGSVRARNRSGGGLRITILLPLG